MNYRVKYLLFVSIFLTTNTMAEYSITAITPKIKKQMIDGSSWQKGCPAPLRDLRYIRVKYLGFDGETKVGQLIMHKTVSKEIVEIFKELYSIRYPIRQMKLVSKYQGNDWRSIEADNTSAFNCRRTTGSKKWSKHAYGKAIDINPIENPYISRRGHISHKNSLKYRKRVHRAISNLPDKALLLKSDKAVKVFEKHGWRWGGDWSGIKDYQHFSK